MSSKPHPAVFGIPSRIVNKAIEEIYEHPHFEELRSARLAPKPFLKPVLIGTRWNPKDLYKNIMETEKMEKPDTLQIKEVENGFTVEAGCKTFVFESLKSLTAALTLFYTDYERVYKKYIRGAK